MFIPGYPAAPFPLSRHLPPLGGGIAAAYGERLGAEGDLVVDPFGQSPRIAFELARLSRRVIIASSHPVMRLALRAALDPLPPQHLRAALTRLADARAADERLEARIRSLYRSTCPECGSAVEVDFFLWDKETLAEKTYYCETCGEDKTLAVSADDINLAARIAPRGPPFYWALDRIAPPDDPDRAFFAEALEAYTARALHALFNLTYKAQALNLGANERRAVELLLLTAYDEGISLEGARPRSLRPHARFREKNIWLILEQLTGDAGLPSLGQVQLRPLADLTADPSPGVCIFEGSARELGRALGAASARLMMTSPPRLNPVLWTLLALWGAWLWDSEVQGAVKNFSRRRYDWSWHEQALRSTLTSCRMMLTDSGRLAVLMPEADSSFLAAVLTAADGSRFTLADYAVRADPPEAQLIFQPDQIAPERHDDLPLALRRRAEQAAADMVRERGEPARRGALSSAALVALAGDHVLRAAVAAVESDPLELVNEQVEKGLTESARLTDLAADMGRDSPRAGWWWLADPANAAEPLADRVERAVARTLAAVASDDEAHATWLERKVCAAFPGLLTPDSLLFQNCLESYGEERRTLWRIRPEDEPAVRAEDVERIAGDLRALGQRFGYDSADDGGSLAWRDPEEGERSLYRFYISGSAAISRFVYWPPSDDARRVIVIPGGRAGLVEYKLRRDPRLRAAVENPQSGWLFLKFRHVRRLLAEPMLDRTAILAALGLDPIVEKGSTQLPLL